MANRPDNDLVAAYHEAGHAVGAFLLRVPIGKIALTGGGAGNVPGTLKIQEIRESNLCWEHAIVALLGYKTEKLFFGRADWDYLEEDAAAIWNLHSTFFPAMSCQAYRAELRKRAAEIVGHPGFREAVESLATLLYREMVVSETRAFEVIQSVMHDSGLA